MNNTAKIVLIVALLVIRSGAIAIDWNKLPLPSAIKPAVSKVDRVTYVYEKDEGPVPPAVSYSLRKLNEAGVLATELEVEPETGLGTIPAQSKIAVEAAKRTGLPSLVIQVGDTVLYTVRAPKTVADVADAVGIKIEEPR